MSDTFEATELARDWEEFQDAWLTHAEEQGYKTWRAELPRPSEANMDDAYEAKYLDFLDEYPWTYPETPDFVDEFGYTELRRLGKEYGVEFVEESDWEESERQYVEDAAEEWVHAYIDFDQAVEDKKADSSSVDVHGTTYYYRDW
jgi:hypothetical protein